MIDGDRVVHEVRYAHPVQAVWRALTDPLSELFTAPDLPLASAMPPRGQLPGRAFRRFGRDSADRPASTRHNGEYTRRFSRANLADAEVGDTSRVRPVRPRAPRPASTPTTVPVPSRRMTGRLPPGQPATSAPAAASAQAAVVVTVTGEMALGRQVTTATVDAVAG